MVIHLWAAMGNKKAKRRQMARVIKRCFDNVDWTKQSFMTNGIVMKAGKEDKFYKAGEIDRATVKLNRLLNILNS